VKNYSAQIDPKNQAAAHRRAWRTLFEFLLCLAAFAYIVYSFAVVFAPAPLAR
jgi:hypothetical protein